MPLNFVEEIVFDWFRLIKNPNGISLTDFPTPRKEGKGGGSHGGDIDILSIGQNKIWVAEVESFGGTKAAKEKTKILKRKFSEKTEFIKEKYSNLFTIKEIEKIYVCEYPYSNKLMNLVRKEIPGIKTYYLTELIQNLIENYFEKNKGTGPDLTPSTRILFTLVKHANCINIKKLKGYNKKLRKF